jgi:hypothetical protein
MINPAHALPIGLLALGAVLCAGVGLELSAWSQDSGPPLPVAPISTERPAAAVPAGPANQHIGWLNEILARPLFSPDRHPVNVGMRGLPRLTGIVVAGSERTAIFAGPANGRPVTAQAGARVGAYEVRSVADDGVIVAGPEGISMIRPAFDTSRPVLTETRPAGLPPAKPGSR